MTMTPEQIIQHEAWLADMNHHKAIGGMLEFQLYKKDWKLTADSPGWASNPDQWRKVPLPRTEKIWVAYKWVDGNFYSCTCHSEEMRELYKSSGNYLKEITVTEEL